MGCHRQGLGCKQKTDWASRVFVKLLKAAEPSDLHGDVSLSVVEFGLKVKEPTRVEAQNFFHAMGAAFSRSSRAMPPNPTMFVAVAMHSAMLVAAIAILAM